MILTDEEIKAIDPDGLAEGFARAIESAVLEKLKEQAPLPPDDVVRDAERYKWLRDTLRKSVGGGVEVNDAALVYEDCEPGEEVRVYWYPDTPIGFHEIKAKTLDAAIDAAMKEMK